MSNHMRILKPSKGAEMCFKLTDANMQTRGGCQWKLGKWNPTGVRHGTGELCADGFYHAYPFLDGEGGTLALLMNPEHANFSNPRLWLAETRGTIKHADDFCKLGSVEQRLIQEVPYVPLTDDDCTTLAILVAGTCDEAESDAEWEAWAEGWLSNRDRTEASADRASARASAWAWTSAWASARASASACARARASAWARASASASACASASASAWARARAEVHQDFYDAITNWKAGLGS
jgi:hypothetical protein